MPLEIRRVSQYAQTGGAMLLIGPGDRHRIEIGTDDPRRGAGLLDLGDELDRAGALQHRAEITGRRGRRRLVLELLQRHPPPRRGDLETLGRHNLIQDGHHHHVSRTTQPIDRRAPAMPRAGGREPLHTARLYSIRRGARGGGAFDRDGPASAASWRDRRDLRGDAGSAGTRPVASRTFAEYGFAARWGRVIAINSGRRAGDPSRLACSTTRAHQTRVIAT